MRQIIITILLFFPGVIQAEEIDYYSLSDSFAECSALQNTLTRLITKSEEEYINHYLHQVANGAIVVAIDFAIAGGYTKDLAYSRYDTHYSRFQSSLSASTDGGDNFINSVKPVMDKCKSLNELQTKIITEKTKQIYKAK